jgi:hypothetical protein
MPIPPFPETWQHSFDDIDRAKEIRLELLSHHRQGLLRSRQLFDRADDSCR